MKTKEPIKKLALKRETLRTLTPSELQTVDGGTWTLTVATVLLTVGTYVSWKVTTKLDPQ
ncbi:MAG TPA: class I lanthipeptide [Polyangia bacterium]|nr:class I lanthipeptide [Polyangia bacterium]